MCIWFGCDAIHVNHMCKIYETLGAFGCIWGRGGCVHRTTLFVCGDGFLFQCRRGPCLDRLLLLLL